MPWRTIVLTLGAVVVVAGALAAAAAWRSRDEMTQDPIGTASIVMLGDSITFGGDWSSLLDDVPVVNQGYPGYTTEQLLPVARDVAERNPRAVLVMTGTNDIRDGHPPSWTVDRLGRVLDAIEERSPSTVVIVQSVLPRGEKAAEIVATNAAIRELAAERGLEYVDLHPGFDDGAGGLRAAETTDGWHLSPAGYRRLADELRPVLDRIG